MKYRVFLFLTLLALLLSIAPLAAQDVTECKTGFRLIEHEAGTDCIPEPVERVQTTKVNSQAKT